MSVVWEPRLPLTAAEAAVDFPATNDHIVRRREAVEKTAAAATRALALVVSELLVTFPRAATERLANRLAAGLDETMRFGFSEARREIAELRRGRTARAAVTLPEDTGDYGEYALGGKEGIREFIRARSQQASAAIADEVQRAAQTPGLNAEEREELLLQRARRALHSSVLSLVGETLNMGRTAGAMSLAYPPEFALRSEQLDKRTCDPCSRLHGEIAQLGSPSYFAILPPTGCLGGGRCRGIMVFGDGPVDLRLPEAA